eukprot:2263065-Pleurochrysis_carterae.AAC.1
MITPDPSQKKDNNKDREGGGEKVGEGKETKSAVPLAMQGWGEGKLETVSEAQLPLALVENNLPLPLPDEKQKAGWASSN